MATPHFLDLDHVMRLHADAADDLPAQRIVQESLNHISKM